jgi:hypothetical protein
MDRNPSKKADDFWFLMGKNDSVAVHQPPEVTETTSRLAIFYIDGTLVRNKSRADRLRGDNT